MQDNRQMAMDLDQTVVQTEEHLVSSMNGEKVMLSVHNGAYYNLGRTGGRIWELLASPITVRRLVAALTEEYEVERDLCEDQVVAFLQKLFAERLIRTEEEVGFMNDAANVRSGLSG